MKFSFQCNKKNLILTGIFFALALIMFVAARYPAPYLLLCPAVYFLICCTGIEFRGSWKWLTWIWTVIYFAAGPVFSTLCIQHVILEPELYRKTKQTILKLNVLCVCCIYLVCLAIFAEARHAWRLAHLFCLFIAFVDYFVYEFRENEVSFADITSVGTGLSVMKSYRLKLHTRGAIALLLTVTIFALIRKSRIEIRRLVRWIIRAAAIAALIALVVYLRGRTAKMATQTWEKKGTYKNGFVLNFVLGIGDAIIHEPEGYSEDIIAQLEEEYGKNREEGAASGTGGADSAQAGDGAEASDDTRAEGAARPVPGALPEGEARPVPGASDAANAAADDGTYKQAADPVKASLNGRKPVVITVMDESFCDFRKVGELTTNKEVMPFIDSLVENTIRGFALSSVYGAKTPNSEWEYMTGNTMAFLPEGSVVYEQFLSKKPTSMVSFLKNEGYTTIAMHPYQNTGWKRNTVYPRFGFDEMYFLEDGYFDETKILRKYITDQELFDKIIDRYERQQLEDPETPMFIMSITMQNHGGYREKYDNFNEEIVYQSPVGYYEDANQFLSLEYETDKALANLIGYFQDEDVPVEIVFFGDHLPSLTSAFFRALNGKGISGLTLTELEALFSVPFFIWTNYDTPEEEIPITSLNFLSTLVLQRAGFDLPPFNRFLADLMEHVPAMNARAFYSPSAGRYLHYDKAEGEEKEWIDKYNYLQYNEMFDKGGRSEYFFPYLNENG